MSFLHPLLITYKVDHILLPSLSQVDETVLKELPSFIREEVIKSMNNQKKSTVIGKNSFANLEVENW